MSDTPRQVTLKPSGHSYSVSGYETILDGALREGYNIPYACRNGGCGSCKGKLLEGTVDYGNYSIATLTDADKANGYALFCQAKPLSDVVVECREVSGVKDIPIRTLPCRVQKLEKLAADGAEPVGSSPEEFGAFIKSELVKWAGVVKAAKLPME